MSLYEEFIARQQRYRCEALSAFLTVDQCQVNKMRKDNPQFDVWAVAACKDCPGVVHIHNFGGDMAKKANLCSVPGCEKYVQRAGKCKAHLNGTDPRRSVPRPQNKSVQSDAPVPVPSNHESHIVNLLELFKQKQQTDLEEFLENLGNIHDSKARLAYAFERVC